MKVYTVCVEDHDMIEEAQATMWNLAYTDLEAVKLAVVEDLLQQWKNRDPENEIEPSMLEWEESRTRTRTWLLVDDLVTQQTWTVMEGELI